MEEFLLKEKDPHAQIMENDIKIPTPSLLSFVKIMRSG